MEVKGTIKLIGETKTFESGFSKREFVLTTHEQYPQHLKIELIKDKCSLLDSYRIGDAITVSINLRGNEYQGKYYVSIQGWKIANQDAEAVQETSQKVEEPQPQSIQDDTDLPF